MDESSNGEKLVLRWPKFAAAAAVLAVILAVIWMAAAVERIRSTRRLFEGSMQTNSASDGTLLRGGNAANGKRIFFEKPEANCAKCHQVTGPGGDHGPSLEGVASRLTRDMLLKSLLKPNAEYAAGYESVVLLLTNSTGVAGFLKEETDSSLTVLTPEDGKLVIPKAAVQLRQRGLSPMPERLDTVLSGQDLRDLVEYLATLK